MYLNLCYRAETKGPAINPAECRIINLSLLNKHTNNVAKHVATCQPCIAKAISSQECTFISDEKHHGLASVISSKCGGCGEVIPFPPLPNLPTPEEANNGPTTLQQCGVRW